MAQGLTRLDRGQLLSCTRPWGARMKAYNAAPMVASRCP